MVVSFWQRHLEKVFEVEMFISIFTCGMCMKSDERYLWKVFQEKFVQPDRVDDFHSNVHRVLCYKQMCQTMCMLQTWMGQVRKLPVTWGTAVVFARYSGFLHHLQLAGDDSAALRQKKSWKRKFLMWPRSWPISISLSVLSRNMAEKVKKTEILRFQMRMRSWPIRTKRSPPRSYRVPCYSSR